MSHDLVGFTSNFRHSELASMTNVVSLPVSHRNVRQAPKRQRARKCKADIDLPYGLTRDSLPFVQVVNGELRHWVVKSTGDYARDCSLGREYAGLFLPFLRICLGHAMLAWIVLDMRSSKSAKGIVVGFLGTIGKAVSISMTQTALLDPETDRSKAWEDLAFKASVI
jgi:hypothetical protein